MIKVVLVLRLAQLRRIIVELGLFRSLVVLFFLFHLTTLAISYRNNPQESLKILSLMAASLGFLHVSRPDKSFFKILDAPVYVICLTEYLLLGLPLIISWILSGQWSLAAGLILFVGIISAIPYRINYNLFAPGGKTLRLSPSFSIRLFSRVARVPLIPSYAFEWISGLRKSWFLLVLLYLGGWFFCGYYFIIPIVLFAFGLVTTGFYFECESREFLEGYHRMDQPLVRRKCLVHLSIFGIIHLPLIALHVLLHSSFWYLLLYALLSSAALQVFSIVLKYALYVPNTSLQRNAILIGFSLLGFLLPHIAAVPILMTLFYYRKATRNVKSYFA